MSKIIGQYISEIFYNNYYPFISCLLEIIEKYNLKNYKDFIDFNQTEDIYNNLAKFQENNNDNDKIIYNNLIYGKLINNYFNFKENSLHRYFYYTTYLDEKYISEKLKYLAQSKYAVLRRYLQSENDKRDKSEYLIDNINIFNNGLNLINQYYFNNISRNQAEKIRLKDTEIYSKNKELIDNFIKIFNNLEIENIKCEKLDSNNFLCDFFIDENNNFGKAYKIIFNTFIRQQNKEIENLLDLKISNGIFDLNCKNKINIQEINKNDIFNLKLPEDFSFINILFHSSYRKIQEDINYNSCIEYIINFDLIEKYMTDLLLKNKKLLNETIDEFIYSNEVFTNQVTDVITLFENNYLIESMNIDDKVVIYKFFFENENNLYLHKKIIQDFIKIIKYLNNISFDKENELWKNTTIYEIIELNDETSNIFLKLFQNQEGLTVSKIIDIFDYYLKLIYVNVSK